METLEEAEAPLFVFTGRFVRMGNRITMKNKKSHDDT
jgi:hypothetical protein